MQMSLCYSPNHLFQQRSSQEREVAVKSMKAAALLLILAAAASAVLADTVAYVVPAGTAGNQAYTGALGMDFNVNSPIIISQLGVFDDGSDGLQAPLEARLYQRDDTDPECKSVLLATIDFTPDDQGTPMDGSLFKPLPTPITLPAGFTGTIVASGYGPVEMNGNYGVGGHGTWTTDDGGGLISFVGGGRYGNDPTMFPATPDGGPANRYAAGTFIFSAAGGGK
jgi:hypothetical protein